MRETLSAARAMGGARRAAGRRQPHLGAPPEHQIEARRGAQRGRAQLEAETSVPNESERAAYTIQDRAQERNAVAIREQLFPGPVATVVAPDIDGEKYPDSCDPRVQKEVIGRQERGLGPLEVVVMPRVEVGACHQPAAQRHEGPREPGAGDAWLTGPAYRGRRYDRHHVPPSCCSVAGPASGWFREPSRSSRRSDRTAGSSSSTTGSFGSTWSVRDASQRLASSSRSAA